jgi:hypothetical protein
MPLIDNTRAISITLRQLRDNSIGRDQRTMLQQQLIELIRPRMGGRQYAMMVHTAPEGNIILVLTILAEEHEVNQAAVALPSEFMYAVDIIQIVVPPSYNVIQVIKDRFDWCHVGACAWPDRTTWAKALIPRRDHWQHLLEDDG